MPLPEETGKPLTELANAAGEFSLFGIFLNPQTGEMGTYSSSGFQPGQVLGFLKQAVDQMLSAAMNGELQYVGGEDAKGTVRPNKANGGKLELIH